MIKNLEQINVTGKRVFLRVDFNVPLKKDENGVIEDDTRIREALPTIQYLIEKGAKIILGSHLGRPKGREKRLSLEPVAAHLSKLLGADVTFIDDCVGDGVEMMLKHLKTSQVVCLENLRFYREEEAGDLAFATKLARLADVYLTDAFGTAHRKHASTYTMATLMAVRGHGFLITKEIAALDRLLKMPVHPYVAVLGGSKVSDKIKIIESLLTKVDIMLIGGAMAHAFCLTQSAAKPEDVGVARILIRKASERGVKLLIPVDENNGFDIGSKTIELFVEEIKKAKTVFWNGPVGMFEKPEYAAGSFALAAAIAEVKGLKVIAGGDTVAAVNQSGFASKMDHLSTGGGATLEYLEGDGLPGITVLHDYNKVKNS